MGKGGGDLSARATPPGFHSYPSNTPTQPPPSRRRSQRSGFPLSRHEPLPPPFERGGAISRAEPMDQREPAQVELVAADQPALDRIADVVERELLEILAADGEAGLDQYGQFL